MKRALLLGLFTLLSSYASAGSVTMPFRCQPLASAPATCNSNTTGRCYSNTADSNLPYWCNGTNWVPAALSTGTIVQAVGDLASPNQSGAIFTSVTWTPTTVSTGLVVGGYGKVTYAGAMTMTAPGHIVGLLGEGIHSTAQIAAQIEGTEGKVQNTNASGTITGAYPVLCVITSNAGTITTASVCAANLTANTGTITNLWMHDVGITTQGGTVTNFAALHMPDLSSFSITNRFFLFSADAAAPIYMNGAYIFGSAAHTWHFGPPDSATPNDQVLVAQGSRGGTDTNVAGASLLVKPGPGTGTGTGSQVALYRNVVGATGTTAQTQTKAYVSCPDKTLSNSTGQAAALVTIGTVSNSSGSLTAWIGVQCNDGTNFDSDTVSCNVSYVNKAGTVTFSTATCTSNSAVNNSGSCTIGATVTASSASLNINVTPVISTIVPTSTTGWADLLNRTASAATITCN